MADAGVIAPLAILSAGFGWAGKAIIAAITSRGDRAKAQQDTDARLEEHRDGLTFDLLNAARSEIATLRQEVSDLRPIQVRMGQLEVRLARFDEALEFIERLMAAGTPEERAATERQARAFVTRMRRLADAHGVMANEAQRDLSADRLPPDMRDTLNKMP